MVFTAMLASRSPMGVQEAPPSVVLKTPPATAPAYITSGLSGRIRSELVRPPILPGPSSTQSPSEASLSPDGFARLALEYSGMRLECSTAAKYLSTGISPVPMTRFSRSKAIASPASSSRSSSVAGGAAGARKEAGRFAAGLQDSTNSEVRVTRPRRISEL